MSPRIEAGVCTLLLREGEGGKEKEKKKLLCNSRVGVDQRAKRVSLKLTTKRAVSYINQSRVKRLRSKEALKNALLLLLLLLHYSILAALDSPAVSNQAARLLQQAAGGYLVGLVSRSPRVYKFSLLQRATLRARCYTRDKGALQAHYPRV